LALAALGLLLTGEAHVDLLPLPLAAVIVDGVLLSPAKNGSCHGFLIIFWVVNVVKCGKIVGVAMFFFFFTTFYHPI